jgi:hypothetical protein
MNKKDFRNTVWRIGREIGEETGRQLRGFPRDITQGVFTAAMLNDAFHVAAAVVTRQDVLLSWNFRHLVNRRRRARVNEVNVEAGLPILEILAPPEL